MVRDQQGSIVLEVGGKGKGRSQFKGIKVNRKLIFSHGNVVDDLRRPLFLLGYLYQYRARFVLIKNDFT